MTVYDIYGNTERPGAVRLDGGRKNEIHWGKSFWVFEQLRGMDPEFLSKYFRAKRKYVPARMDHRYKGSAPPYRTSFRMILRNL